MDFNSFKEILKNIYNTAFNNSAVYFIKEKYDHLSSFYRKTIQIISALLLTGVLLYYPSVRFYSSWKHTKSSKTKTQLIHDLINLSSKKTLSGSQGHTAHTDPLRFVERKIPTLLIPKNQITKIEAIQNSENLKKLAIPAKVKTVKLEMKELNLKETIQYGHKLEQLSDNIKLMNLSMKESQEKENYFNVSYILSFFSPRESIGSKVKKKEKRTYQIKKRKSI